MTTVYLLRHGQSEANVAQVFTGQNDRYPLSLLGHRQADLAACYLASVGVQRIYASDLTRAVQTASHVANALCLPVHTDTQLREIYAGEWEGQHFADLVLRYPRTYASWRAGTCCNPTGGETASEAATRFYTAVERMCVQNADKVLLIVAHAMVIRCFECLVCYGTLQKLPNVSFVKNAAVSRYMYENGKFHLCERDLCTYLGADATELPKTV